MADRTPRPATFAQVFRVGEFRWLFTAQLISVGGDQLARVALSVLVYDRTRSSGLTALTYALTFLPDLLGGPLLSGLADRLPRRRVMIAADLMRAVLAALMAIHGLPLPVVAALLVAVQLLSAPATAARAALLPQVLEGDRFVVGSATLNMTMQLAHLVGFVTGGVVVAAVGVGGALLLDAGTFAVSALLVRLGVRHRPAALAAAAAEHRRGRSWLRSAVATADLVWSDRRLRALVALGCVAGFYIAGEALAAPYAAEVGGGPLAVGLLLAAYPAGTVAGMAWLARLPHDTRLRLMPAMAVLACVPLVVCVLRPGLPVTLLLWACSGASSAYHLTASTTFVASVVDECRGQAVGLAVTALRLSQGLGVAGAGLAAEAAAASLVIAVAGVVGLVAAVAAAKLWYRSGSPAAAAGGRHAAGRAGDVRR